MRRPGKAGKPGKPGKVGGGLVLAAAAAAFGLGAWLVLAGSQSRTPPSPSAADAFAPGAFAPSGADSSAAGVSRPGPVGLPALPPSVPARIRIPRVGVDAPVTGVDVDGDGRLPAPPSSRRNLAGWYQRSATPGSVGTAVIDGHVDTAAGPAVFWTLGALHRGDLVDIVRADRAVAEFTVDAVEVYAKTGFPSQRVYGDTDRPELRLLTCGGGYRKGSGYLGNVVVFAHLTGVRGPGQADSPPRHVA